VSRERQLPGAKPAPPTIVKRLDAILDAKQDASPNLDSLAALDLTTSGSIVVSGGEFGVQV